MPFSAEAFGRPPKAFFLKECYRRQRRPTFRFTARSGSAPTRTSSYAFDIPGERDSVPLTTLQSSIPTCRSIRHGEITAYQDDTPYCIAEVMADDERLPEELRNRWLLAFGFWENHFQQRHRLVRQGGATNSPASINAILEKLPSGFYFELVHWDDDPVKPRYGSGNLRDVPKLKIQWIERGSNVLSRATQDLLQPFKFGTPKAALRTERKRAE